MKNGDTEEIATHPDLYGDDLAVYAYRTDEVDAETDPERITAGTPLVAIFVARGGVVQGSGVITPSVARALAADLYLAAATAETESW